MAEVEKLQRALKKMIDLFFADLVRSEQLLQVEVREASIGHPRRQKFPQAAGIDGSECPDFFEDHALKWVFKYSGIEQPANLKARPALDQHRAEKPQRVSLELKSAVCFSSMHWNALKRAFFDATSHKDEGANRIDWKCCASPAHQSWAVYNK